MGTGIEIELEMLIQLTDEQTGAELIGASVSIEEVVFKQDANNKLMWKGKIRVPKGETIFEILVETIDQQIFTKTIKLFNKPGSIKPLIMGINPGSYILTYDPTAHLLAKIKLTDFSWTEYIRNDQLAGTDILFDFNSANQNAYTVVDGNNANNKRVVAAGITEVGLPQPYYAGLVDKPVNLTYDSKNQRLLVLSKTAEQPDKFRALGIPVTGGTASGFKFAKSEAQSFDVATFDLAWDIPLGTTQGVFKSFAYYRAEAMFILADERVINGATKTLIQVFSEGVGGQALKKFEVVVGADISNIAVNNGNSNVAGGFAYLAENKSSLMASKLKVIDLNKGEVADLVVNKGNVTVASYTELRIDNLNQILYVADAVADSIYEINLSNKALKELPLNKAQVVEPPSVDN